MQTQEEAQAKLKERFNVNPLSAKFTMNPACSIFIVKISQRPNSTSRRVKYFLTTGLPGWHALEDITGLVGRASGKGWNNNDGTFTVKGGDGSDAINTLSIQIFGDHKTIPVFFPF